jgi:hypothetical protein
MTNAEKQRDNKELNSILFVYFYIIVFKIITKYRHTPREKEKKRKRGKKAVKPKKKHFINPTRKEHTNFA